MHSNCVALIQRQTAGDLTDPALGLGSLGAENKNTDNNENTGPQQAIHEPLKELNTKVTSNSCSKLRNAWLPQNHMLIDQSPESACTMRAHKLTLLHQKVQGSICEFQASSEQERSSLHLQYITACQS
jgi:hypothetical protein